VAQKNSLFDDPTQQIEDLTVVIKHQIDSIRKDVEVINKPESKTFSLFQKNKQAQNHWDSILNFLNSRLADTTKQFSTSLINRTQVDMVIMNH
jgi:syntaxin 5